MADKKEQEGISRHLEKVKDDFKGDFKGGIAGEYATPSKLGKDDTKYFGEGTEGSEKTCPSLHKKFKDFATIAPSDTELQYYCPFCDTLIAREFDDNGERKTEVYDWDHMIK